MTAESFDLAVIGGGPAGAAAAWTAARRGVRVALLERGAYPRDKVCGEFFSAEGLPLLGQMAPELAASAPAITTAAFVSQSGERFEFRLPAAARGISRLALDAALWKAAGAAGAVVRGRAGVSGVARDGGAWRLWTEGRGEIRAGALIVAAGRWWHVAGLEGGAPPRRPTSDWVGVKARFRGLAPSQAVEMYCFPGGYCGAAPVEHGWTNACCLVRRDRLRPGAGELGASRDFAGWIGRASGSAALAARLRGGEQASATVVTAPVEIGARRAAQGTALLAGDASGFIDPFTGDGMARALLSGQLAAEWLGDPEGYEAAMRGAARLSYRASAGLRAVAGAPGWLQAAALWTLAGPAAGPRLVTATRWRTL